jgi:hypothetical protein
MHVVCYPAFTRDIVDGRKASSNFVIHMLRVPNELPIPWVDSSKQVPLPGPHTYVKNPISKPG